MQASHETDASIESSRASCAPVPTRLSGGIRALALVSAISTAATLAMTATTVAHMAWPNIAFQVLGMGVVVAVVVAHARRVSAGQLMFMAGVIAASLPSLVIAALHWLDHWDDFMTWLPNAVYIWEKGGFPTAAAPPVASDLPGYPPGSSIVLAALWSLAGRVVDNVGPVLNVLCLMILPGVTLRALDVGPQSVVRLFGLGAVLGLAWTILNVGLDWHWGLSSLPEVATLVAFAAAFVLGAECLFRKSSDARPRLVALAAILALVANVKQTGIALVGILIVSVAAVTWIFREDDRRDLRDAALTAALVCLPSAAIWLCWHVYLAAIFTAHAVAFRPLGQWYYSLLPDLLGGMGRLIAVYWLAFVPIAIVLARGLFVLARSWAGGGRAALATGDRLAAIFAVVQTAYFGFLVVCYIGAFNDEEVPRAAEFVRYQAEIVGAGLLVAIVMAAERLRQPRFVALAPAFLALQLAAVWALWPAAGVYQWGGVLPAVDIAAIRQLGREAGSLIARDNRQVEVSLVVAAQPLALIVIRYEMWASAPSQIVAVKASYADNGIAGFVDQLSAAARTGPLVGFTEAGPRCGFYVDGGRVDLLPTSKTSADCRSLLLQVTERSSTRKSTSTQ
jgi:hypothetical protein